MGSRTERKWTTDGIAEGTEPNGDLVVNAEYIAAYAFASRTGITSLVLQNMTSNGLYPFKGCTGLKSLVCPNMTSNGPKFDASDTPNLEYASFPKLQELNYDQFLQGTKVTSLVFPAFTGRTYTGCFSGNKVLSVFDIASPTGIYSKLFNGCTVLSTLILRGAAIPSLSNVDAFTGTPFANGGSGGTIYIPKSLYDHLGDGSASDYKAASNWSTIDGYGTITWAKIEGSYYETHYGDGTPIPSA